MLGCSSWYCEGRLFAEGVLGIGRDWCPRVRSSASLHPFHCEFSPPFIPHASSFNLPPAFVSDRPARACLHASRSPRRGSGREQGHAPHPGRYLALGREEEPFPERALRHGGGCVLSACTVSTVPCFLCVMIYLSPTTAM